MLSGVGVALVTPFDDDLKVDYLALGSLIEYVLPNVDYIVALGTTAETATLSQEEQREILDFVISKVDSRCPIVVGIGGNNTADIVERITKFDFSGVDALLSVTPFYNKPSQEGIFQHYIAVAESSPVPLILYNVPSRTGVNMCADTILRLAKANDKIVAVKDASANLSQISTIIKGAPSGFMVLSGDDNTTPAVIAMGAKGVISVAANCFPAIFKSVVDSSLSGDMATMRAGYYRIMEAVDLLFAEGNPVGAKAVLSIKGILQNNLRLPLVSASEHLTERLTENMRANEL